MGIFYYNKIRLFRIWNLEVWWWQKVYYNKQKEGTPEKAIEDKMKEISHKN